MPIKRRRLSPIVNHLRRRRKRRRRNKRLRQPRPETKFHFHIPYDRIRDYLAVINERRINLEVYFKGEDIDNLNDLSLKELLQGFTYTPSFSLHGPFMDLSPGAVDALVREVTLKRFYQTLETASLIGSETVVLHSGYDKWRYDHRVELWLGSSIKTWKPILREAEDRDIRIAIENIFEDEPGSLRMLMEAMDSPNFGVCFDTGHFNLFSNRPLDEWMDEIGEYIIELHIHDNDGTKDSHIAPGSGIFDFKTLFGRLGISESEQPAVERHLNKSVKGQEIKNILVTAEVHSFEEVGKTLNFLRIHLPLS